MRTGLVAVAVGVLLAGCSGGSDGERSTPAPTTTVATTHVSDLRVTSSAFTDGQAIPERFTCYGGTAAPDVAWRGVPKGAVSVALVVKDPDVTGDPFIHWVLYDLPPTDGKVTGATAPAGAREGGNTGGGTGWTSPCPPGGPHHYEFTVYALSGHLTGATTDELLAGLDKLTVARGTLTGIASPPAA